LLKRLGAEPEEQSLPPSTALGDWYAQLTVVDRKPLVLAVSERTLLPVIVPLAPAKNLRPRLVDATHETLLALLIPEPVVSEECEAMRASAFGATNNRQILGSINDFLRMLDSYLRPHETFRDAALGLAEAPCGPIGMDSPRERTIALLSPRTRGSGGVF